MSKENKLLITFTRFMLEHGIECEEDIYQNDKVDEDSLELIEDLFYIVKLTNHTRHTNADMIRNMSDEELADFLDDVGIPPCDCCCHNECESCWKDWLQSEAE